MNKLTTNYKAVCFKTVEEDNYNKGADYHTHQDFGKIWTIRGESKKEIIQAIQDFHMAERGDLDIGTIERNRIDYCTNENGAGEKPTAAEIESWEKGNSKMWIADYSWYVTREIVQDAVL